MAFAIHSPRMHDISQVFISVFIVLINILTVISSFDSSSKAVNQKMTAKETTSSTSWPSMIIPPSSASLENSVPAIMNYVSEKCKDISTRRDLGGGDSALIGAIWKPTQVNVNNARILDGDDRMTLDKNGFQLWSESNGKEKDIQQLDFCNQDEVVDSYYPICEDLVRDALKSQRLSSTPLIIQAFDHNIRSNDKASVGEIKRASTANEEDDSANPQVQNPAGIGKIPCKYCEIYALLQLYFLKLISSSLLNTLVIHL